ncbi:unnamed protein product [Sphagnum jensenii]|uniref:Protein kinase domain-containing protein n=1 Tax=Sphagnum jensenii TaxID=128206 RepID=A0ABP0WH92_9BRYO
MDGGRFKLGRLSSLAPEDKLEDALSSADADKLKTAKDLESVAELLYCACKGDVQGIEGSLAKGVNVDAADFDGRTALHLAACEGQLKVVEFLISKGANVNPADRWGSTPLADAQHYKNAEVCKFLEEHGGRSSKQSLQVRSRKEVPEYEIDPSKLIFTKTKVLTGKYRVAIWHGTKVAVKELYTGDLADEGLRQFRSELDLLQKLRHPNVVQFLGAVTQSAPLMIITEFLPGLDLAEHLKKGRLDPEKAVIYALDIARGMNYLHEHKPEAIIHRDLKPSNLLRDAKHLKVADFGLSLPTHDPDTNDYKMLKRKGTSCRYMAPELYQDRPYNKCVDVFSFALIVQEMMEGVRPFESQEAEEVAKIYANEDRRPPFKHHARRYPNGLKTLIEECWSTEPTHRPSFAAIITRLTDIQSEMGGRRCLGIPITKCIPQDP